MRKWVWMVATALAATLLAAGPVLAMDMTCQPTVQSLANCVQDAYSHGYIDSQGVETTLLSQTAAAQSALDNKQPAAAINVLQAFIQTVQAQRGVHIQAEHADHIVKHAQMVIAALSALGS